MIKPSGRHGFTQRALAPFARVVLAGQTGWRKLCLDPIITCMTRDFLYQVFFDRHVVPPGWNRESQGHGIVFAQLKAKRGEDTQHFGTRNLQTGNSRHAFRTQ